MNAPHLLAVEDSHEPASAPLYQRSAGEISVCVEERGGVAALTRGFQRGAGRLRVTGRRADAIEALTMNTAGGLAAGDKLTIEAQARGGGLTLSTVACERIYRTEEGAAPAVIEQRFRVASGARLAVLPQPTIAFDGAAFMRTTNLSASAGAAFVLCEGLVLGRQARGETVREALIDDRLRVTVDGTLRFVDALRLRSRTLASTGPAGLAGARGIGIVVASGRTMDAAQQRVRDRAAALSGARAGATMVNGVLVARVLAVGHTALQDALAQIVHAIIGEPVPRAWRL